MRPISLSRAIPICCCCVCAFGTAVSLVVALNLLPYVIPRSDPPHLAEDVFCCPDLVRHLCNVPNRSIDPCHDFYQYVCHNSNHQEQDTTHTNRIFNSAILPSFLGTRKSRTSRTISRFYRACLATFSGEIPRHVEAIEAIADNIKLPARPTPYLMLRTILRLTILYRLEPGISIQRTSHRRRTFLHIYLLKSVDWDNAVRVKLLKSGLEKLNSITDANITMTAVRYLVRELFVSPNVNETVTSESAILAEFIHGISSKDWMDLLREYSCDSSVNAVHHSNLNSLKTFFSVLTNPILQRTALTLMIVEAGVRAWEELTPTPGGFNMYSSCYDGTLSNHLLWDMAIAEEFTDPRKDAVIRDLFSTITHQVVKLATDAFHSQDSHKVNATITSLRLILPSDMLPRNVKFPELTLNYWQNKMAMREFELKVRKMQVALGIPSYRYGAHSDPLVGRISNSVFVSAAVYAMVNFSETAEPLINMAAVGPLFASPLWKILMRTGDRYSTATAETMQGYLECLTKSPVDSNSRLSLEAALRAAKGHDWYKPVKVLGATEMSRAQIFYMTFALTLFCSEDYADDGRRMSLVSRITNSMYDFRIAFGCPPLKYGTRLCSLIRD